MQRAAGVASFGDINQLLSTAPRDVVELLRIAGRIVTTGGGGVYTSYVVYNISRKFRPKCRAVPSSSQSPAPGGASQAVGWVA